MAVAAGGNWAASRADDAVSPGPCSCGSRIVEPAGGGASVVAVLGAGSAPSGRWWHRERLGSLAGRSGRAGLRACLGGGGGPGGWSGGRSAPPASLRDEVGVQLRRELGADAGLHAGALGLV